jgi:hypothetical protein
MVLDKFQRFLYHYEQAVEKKSDADLRCESVKSVAKKTRNGKASL